MGTLQLADFLAYRSLSSLELSPDGREVAFIVRQPDLERNDYVSDIYRCSLATGSVAALTTGRRVVAFDWTADGHSILFLERARNMGEGPHTQVVEVGAEGGAAEIAFTLQEDATRIKVLDACRVLYLLVVDASPNEPAWPDADCEVADELPVWRDGDGQTNKRRAHLFLYNRSTGCSEQLTGGFLHVEAFDVRAEQVLFSAFDYDQVAPLCNDLYLVDLVSRRLRRLTNQTHWFIGPRFLSDTVVAALGSDMARYGLRQNKEVLALNLRDGRLQSLTPRWDKSDRQHIVVTDVRWGNAAISRASQGRFYCVTPEGCSAYLNEIDFDGKVTRLVDCPGTVDDFDVRGGTAVYIALRGTQLQEIYALRDGAEKRLTALNDAALVDKSVSVPEHLTVHTAPGVAIDAWVMRPAGYESGKRYPAILHIHGGPKAISSSIFRHEHQMLANQGYAVFHCNPRGSDGRGDAFHAEVIGNPGVVDYDDIMATVDEIVHRYDFIDPERLGVTGSSYGGFLVNWIIGHTHRFRAAVSSSGISDLVSMFGTTEIGYYWTEQYLTVTPWQDTAKYWFHSPLRYAGEVSTPTLFLEAEEDYVCGTPQAFEMFTALKHFGVETRLCLFRGEAHGLSYGGKPKNRIRYWTEMLAWFDAHLKN
ncbi:MAG TPA: S9 family peptidase [Anaerolineae bacterium]|nr:S9 family peptidase [Anaerolineae bacterium]